MAWIGTPESIASELTLLADQKAATRYLATSSFTATGMGALFGNSFATGEYARLAIYADSSGLPGDLLDYTDTFEGTSLTGYKSAPLQGTVSITSGTYYWLAAHTDSSSSVYRYSTSGTSRLNSDTFSDGISDPFGGAGAGTDELTIWACDTQGISGIQVYGSTFLTYGGAILTDSAGAAWAIGAGATSLMIYKQVYGAFIQQTTQAPSTIFGGGNIVWVDAAIDSSDIIHVVAACSAEQTRDIAYNTYEDGVGWGTWVEAADYTETFPANPGCAISVDSSDYPRILYVDRVKISGGATDQVYYTHNVGAGWITPEQVNNTTSKNNHYDSPTLTCCPANDVEAFYYYNTNGDPEWRRRNSSWGSATVYTETSATIGGVTCTTGDTVYRYHADSGADIEENDADTGYNTHASYDQSLPVLSPEDGTTRYVFYIDTSNDVHLISNDGGGWADEGALQTGTYYRMAVEWAYNHENQSGQINYLFAASEVFFAYYEIGGPPEPSVSDSVSVSDTPAVVLGTLTAATSDSITVSDDPDAAVTGGLPEPSVSDAVTVSDAPTAEIGVAASASDSVTVADSPTANILEEAAVADSVTVADAPTVRVVPLVGVSDAISVSDDPTVATQVAVATSDAISVADDPTVRVIPLVEVSDAVSVADDPTAYEALPASTSDAVSVSDTPGAELPTLPASVSDSVTVADTPTVSTGEEPPREASVSDGVTLTDSPTPRLDDLALAVADGVSVSDTPDVALPEIGALAVSVSDSVGVSDAPGAVLGLLVAALGSVGVSDDPTVGVSGIPLEIGVIAVDPAYWVREIVVVG